MEKLNSNVIPFPMEQRLRKIDEEKNSLFDFLEVFSEELTSDILAELYNNGYEIDSDDYVYDVSMLFESLRSLIFRLNDIEHSIQEFAKVIYEKYLHENNMQDMQLSLDFGEEEEL